MKIIEFAKKCGMKIIRERNGDFIYKFPGYQVGPFKSERAAVLDWLSEGIGSKASKIIIKIIEEKPPLTHRRMRRE